MNTIEEIYIFENAHWVVPFGLILLALFFSVGLAYISRATKKSKLQDTEFSSIHWHKFLQRKWIVTVWAGLVLVYIIVRDGELLTTNAGIIAIILCGLIVMIWLIFEHIGDNQQSIIRLKWGDKSLEIGQNNPEKEKGKKK